MIKKTGFVGSFCHLNERSLFLVLVDMPVLI
jgi:hypothetical protein